MGQACSVDGIYETYTELRGGNHLGKGDLEEMILKGNMFKVEKVER